MRAKSQWTPGGIVLWLVAALIATVLVCSERRSGSGRLGSDEVKLEVDVSR